jgi:hypothetical protein
LVRKNDRLDIVDGSTPSETEKEAAHRAGAGNVKAPAIPGVMPHRGKKKNEENLWMMVRTWTDSHPIREPLGTSVCKEGAVGSVGERSLQKKLSHKKTSQADTSLRKERSHADMLLGMSSLKEGSM